MLHRCTRAVVSVALFVCTRAVVSAALVVCTAIAAPLAQAAGWEPKDNVELIIPAGAGGSLDYTGRIIERIWQDLKLVPTSTTVVNKAGGGHAIAYGYLDGRKRNPYEICITSSTLLTNHINGRLPYTYDHFTPLAIMATEYIAFVVKADSPLKTAQDMLDRLKKDPQSLSIGLSSALGGTHHLSVAMPLQSAGVNIKKLKLVAFNSSSDAITDLMGGHVDVISTSSSTVTPRVEDGSLRVIAVSSPQRIPGTLADVPTWPEMHLKGVWANWRGVMGAQGIGKAQVAYWDHVLKSVAESKEFQDYAAKNKWAVDYKDHVETRAFMKQSYAEIKALMTTLGFAKPHAKKEKKAM